MACHTSQHASLLDTLSLYTPITEKAQRCCTRYGAPVSIVDPLLSLLFDLHHLQERVLSELERLGVSRDAMPHPFGPGRNTRDDNDTNDTSATAAMQGNSLSSHHAVPVRSTRPTVASTSAHTLDALSVYCQCAHMTSQLDSRAHAHSDLVSSNSEGVMSVGCTKDKLEEGECSHAVSHECCERTNTANHVSTPSSILPECALSMPSPAQKAEVVKAVLHGLDALPRVAASQRDSSAVCNKGSRLRVLSGDILAYFVAAACKDARQFCTWKDRGEGDARSSGTTANRKQSRCAHGESEDDEEEIGCKFMCCEDGASMRRGRHAPVRMADSDAEKSIGDDAASHHDGMGVGGDVQMRGACSLAAMHDTSDGIVLPATSLPSGMMHVGSFTEEDMHAMTRCWKEYERHVSAVLLQERRLLRSVCADTLAARPTLHAKYSHDVPGRSGNRVRRMRVPTCEGVARNCTELIHYHDALAQCQSVVHDLFTQLSDAVDSYMDEAQVVLREETLFWQHVRQLECEHRALHEIRRKIRQLRRIMRRKKAKGSAPIQ